MKRLSLILIIALLFMAKATVQITPPENQEEETQTQEYEQLIFGAWINNEIPDTKYEFNTDGTATVYYGEGTQPDTYNWHLYTTTEQQDNHALPATKLLLIDTFDQNDTVRFDASVGEDYMEFETQGAGGTNFERFHRQ